MNWRVEHFLKKIFLTGVNPAEVAPVIGEPIQQPDTTEDEPEPDTTKKADQEGN